jgi:putative transcriptional regulator
MKIIKPLRYVLYLFVVVLYLVAAPVETISSDNHETVPLQQGVFLVAKPHLSDPNFIHSVILLVSYGKEGAMGLLINKPAYIQLRHLVPEVKGMKGVAIPIYKGGPVSISDINILFTSDTPKEGALQVFDNVYFTGRKEMILSLLQDEPLNAKVRVYAGYTGWAPGQLEHEIMRGDWITINADVKKIFAEEPARIWPSIFTIREEMMI